MGIEALRTALREKNRDDFDSGTVIRWTASGYTYAAVKTPVGWYTTARPHNTYVPQKMTFDRLVDILAKNEVTQIDVAATWVQIRHIEEGYTNDYGSVTDDIGWGL